MTILMGVVGRYPFALATGLGLNAFVAVSIASQMSWQDAMGLVVLEGVVITLLVLTPDPTAAPPGGRGPVASCGARAPLLRSPAVGS